MIKTAQELKTMGKQVSENFMKNSESLDSQIEKLASTGDYTIEQLNRIAEAANVETYVAMAKTGNHYVTFEMANPRTELNIVHEKTAEDLSDYEDIKLPEPEFSFGLVGIELTKAAEKEETLDQIIKIANTRLIKLAREEKEVLASYAKLTELADEFTKTAKQIVLETGNKDLLVDFIKTSGVSGADAFIALIEEECKNINRFLNKTASLKTASYNLQKLQDLGNLTLDAALDFIDIEKNYAVKAAEVSKYVDEHKVDFLIKNAGFLSMVGKSLAFPFKHPMITAGLTLPVIAYAGGKRTARLEAQPLNSVSSRLANMASKLKEVK